MIEVWLPEEASTRFLDQMLDYAQREGQPIRFFNCSPRARAYLDGR